MDCSLLGSSVHGIFQARILEWVGMSFSRGLPDPWIEPECLMSPALADRFFTTGATWSFSLIIPSTLQLQHRGNQIPQPAAWGLGVAPPFASQSLCLCATDVLAVASGSLESPGWRY